MPPISGMPAAPRLSTVVGNQWLSFVISRSRQTDAASGRAVAPNFGRVDNTKLEHRRHILRSEPLKPNFRSSLFRDFAGHYGNRQHAAFFSNLTQRRFEPLCERCLNTIVLVCVVDCQSFSGAFARLEPSATQPPTTILLEQRTWSRSGHRQRWSLRSFTSTFGTCRRRG